MSYELKDDDYLKLWMYFEDRADKIKAAMLSMFTWLVGFKVALLSFIFANFANYDGSKAKLELYVIVISAAVAGLAICFYSFYMLSESGHHIKRNWDRSKNFRKRVYHLDNMLNPTKIYCDKKKDKSICVMIYELFPTPLFGNDKLMLLIEIWNLFWTKFWNLLTMRIEIWDQLRIIVFLFGIAFSAVPFLYLIGLITFSRVGC